MLLYHLLWELTHVCFEHPGLLTEPDECTDEVCITCSDEGRLGEVVGPGRVRTADGSRTCVTCWSTPWRPVTSCCRTRAPAIGAGGREDASR